MKKKFMTINISWNIIELFLIFLFTYFISARNIDVALSVVGFISLIFIGVSIRLFIMNPFGKSIVKDAFEKLDEKHKLMFKKAEELKASKINYKYVNYKQLHNPAFYFAKTVYVNTNSKINGDYFEGLLAHELGHAVSGFGDYSWVLSFRLSTIVSNLLRVFRNQRHQKNRRKKKKNNVILDSLIYKLANIISVMDRFIMYPYIIEEEFKANDIALKLSDGYSLRTYYYSVHKQRKFKHDPFDLKHPPVSEMLIRMEILMDLNEYTKDVYFINDKIYFVANTKGSKETNVKKHLFYLHVADQFNPEVLNHLSNNFFKGIGTEVDYDLAKDYSLKAVEYGYERGYINLGLISEKLEKYEESLYYLNRAKELELKNVDRIIKRITKKLEVIKEEGIDNEVN